MPQILCIACFIALFQLCSSNALLVILISDYGLLLEKTIILFENLFKPRQRRLALDIWLLTSSVLSTTSKQCFEQPAASFLVCSLIFIEYESTLINSFPVRVGRLLVSFPNWLGLLRLCPTED